MQARDYKVTKPRGLGDTVRLVTEVTGGAKLVDKVSKVTGKPCGCKNRQEKLNEVFPYNEK